MTVGELIVKIGADIKEYQKKIEEVQKKNKKLYDTFNKVGNASIAAGTAMLTGIGFAVKAAAEEEEAQLKLKMALQNTNQYTDEQFQSMVQLANQLQATTKFGDEATQEMMAFGLSLGLSAEQVKTLTPLVLDLSTVAGVDVQTAMRAAAMATQGQTGMLRRYGVDVKKAEDGTVKFSDVVQALSVYQGQATAQGKSFSGQLAILKNAFADLAKPIGNSVIPYLLQLIEHLKKGIDWFNKLSPAVKNVIGPMMMFGGLGLVVAGGIMKMIGPLTQIIGLLPAVASGFMTIQAAGGPILWIIEAIAAAVALLYLAWKNNWGGIRDKTQEVIEFLKPYITTAWNVIKTTILTTVRIIHDVVTGDWEDLKNVAQTIWNGIKNIIVTAWNSIKEKSTEIWNGIVAGIQNLWTSIQTTISSWGESLVNLGHEIVGKLVTGIANAYEGFRSVVSELWSIIWTVINTWWENLINFGHEIVGKIATGIANKYKGFRKVVNELWEIIKSVFNKAWSGLLDIGRKIVEGIWSGIKGATGWILGKLKSWVGDVLGWLKKMFGIGSPSKITTEYGKFLGLGLVEGIEKTIPDVARAIDSMVNLTKGFSVEPSLAANAGFSNVPKTTTFNLSVNVNVENMSGDEQDIYELSRKVAEEIRKEIMIYQLQEA